MFHTKRLLATLFVGAMSAFPAGASELTEAKAAYNEAFERYTKLVTTDAGTGNVLQALEEYQQAHIRYMQLRNASGSPTNQAEADSKPAKLDTTGIDGIVGIEDEDAPVPAPEQPASPKISSLKGQAQAGNPQAMTVLALAYQTGYNGQADPLQSIELLQQAAKAGDANAMLQLANEYESGLWIKPDKNKADTLRKQAASQGSLLAEWELESHE